MQIYVVGNLFLFNPMIIQEMNAHLIFTSATHELSESARKKKALGVPYSIWLI